MFMWGHALKCNVVLAKRGFEVVGTLVINFVKCGHIAVVL